MKVVAGVDLGGTAINYTFLDQQGQFLIEGLCEHPARSVEGPTVCLGQIAEGLAIAAEQAGVRLENVVAIGLDTPGPASGTGVLSKRGSTNFVHSDWAGFDIRAGLERQLGRPVTYLNDGNAAALWGHVAIFGSENTATSVSAIIGTGLGGGVITGGKVISGRNGFGGELGHVLIPYTGRATWSRSARSRRFAARCCPLSWRGTRTTSSPAKPISPRRRNAFAGLRRRETNSAAGSSACRRGRWGSSSMR